MATRPANTITVGPVNVKLLRRQRDQLVRLHERGRAIDLTKREADALDGVTNLLDRMLDIADGVR